MFQAEEYVKVKSLEEAYELCQKRNNLILGGTVWLKMSKGKKRTLIDLSDLGLNQIHEEESEFSIGCMCSLRQLETHPGLNACFRGIFRECVRGIVGVQMRNCATVGGSVYGRFGFSDVLTCLMALDCEVELYHAGRMSLKDFAETGAPKDILVRIWIRKDGRRAAYVSQRNTKTDFPLITCAVSCYEGKWYVSVGARPARAQLICLDMDEISCREKACEAADSFTYGSNLRGSSEYRHKLAQVYIRRMMEELVQEGGVQA